MGQLHLDGHVYTSTILPTKAGLRTFVRLGKMIGPGFARLVGDPEIRKSSVAGPEFSALIADLFDRLDNPELEATVETLMDTVECDGASMSKRWMAEFSGKIATLCKVLVFVAGEQFGDFTTAFASAQNSAVEATKAKAKS